MSDSILASGDRKEGLSRAYVQAVASAAGYTLAEQNFDRDGVDLQVRVGGAMRPKLDISEQELVMRRCAYWVAIAGAPESGNEHTVTISIPTANRLDVPALRDLMERSRKMEALMKVRILDGAALRSVNPGGLAAYAGSAGWAKVEPYGDVADVWQGEGLPKSCCRGPISSVTTHPSSPA